MARLDFSVDWQSPPEDEATGPESVTWAHLGLRVDDVVLTRNRPTAHFVAGEPSEMDTVKGRSPGSPSGSWITSRRFCGRRRYRFRSTPRSTVSQVLGFRACATRRRGGAACRTRSTGLDSRPGSSDTRSASPARSLRFHRLYSCLRPGASGSSYRPRPSNSTRTCVTSYPRKCANSGSNATICARHSVSSSMASWTRQRHPSVIKHGRNGSKSAGSKPASWNKRMSIVGDCGSARRQLDCGRTGSWRSARLLPPPSRGSSTTCVSLRRPTRWIASST